MQYHWLNKKNNKNLIVFFAGWSFDYIPFEFLDCKKNDVIIVFDYNSLDYDLPELDGYEHKTLITWSMGVYVGYLLKDKLPNFDKKIAINGTVFPVDDEFGIPLKTFCLTLKFAETGLQSKFYKNVFNNEEWFERYYKNPVRRSIESRVNELAALDKFIKGSQINYDDTYYDRAIIGKTDKIIPTKNQISFWKDKGELVDCGHFPFYNYKSWDEICN